MGLALVACGARAGADDETIGDYATRSSAQQAAYASYMAGLVRPNHPDLTGDQIKACLDGMAGNPDDSHLRLKAAVVLCANAAYH